MFAEFTLKYCKKPALVAIDDVSFTDYETLAPSHCVLHLKRGSYFTVLESYEEVKKRLGEKITPRGETLAI